MADLIEVVVDEAALNKALDDLTTPVEVPEKVEVVKPVEIEPLDLTNDGSLQKAFDVAPALESFMGSISTYVDKALGTLVKSINDQSARDLKIVRVLEGLVKALADNTAAIEKSLNMPVAPVPKSVQRIGVMTKPEDERTDPKAMRKSLVDGLVTLATTGTPSDKDHYSRALVMFEATGQISDEDLKKALSVK